MSKKQKDRTLKVLKKLEKTRERKKVQELQQQEKLNKEAEKLFNDYKERLNIIKSANLDLYKRRKLAEELVEFVNKYINIQYREMFFNDIHNIMNQFRNEEIKSSVGLEEQAEHGGMPENGHNNLNILHVKVAYQIWSKMKTHFNNPVDVGLRLKNHYYEQTINRNSPTKTQSGEPVIERQGEQPIPYANGENGQERLNGLEENQIVFEEEEKREVQENQPITLEQGRAADDLVVNRVNPDN